MASKKKQQNLFSSNSGKLAEYEQKLIQRENLLKRKTRDNRIALVAGVGVLLAAVGSQLIWSSMQVSQVVEAEPSPSASEPAPVETNSPLVPSADLAESRVWSGSMMVNKAKLDIEIFGDKAPQAAANFITLAKKGFYSGVSCHRLTTEGIFVLQCGDPTGTGTGGPGYTFGPIENPPLANAGGTAIYQTGVLAMANSGSAYSNGSQFFIVYGNSTLMPDYTVFGRITAGLDGLKPIIDGGVAADASRPGDGRPAVETKLGDIVLN